MSDQKPAVDMDRSRLEWMNENDEKAESRYYQLDAVRSAAADHFMGPDGPAGVFAGARSRIIGVNTHAKDSPLVTLFAHSAEGVARFYVVNLDTGGFHYWENALGAPNYKPHNRDGEFDWSVSCDDPEHPGIAATCGCIHSLTSVPAEQ